MAVAKRPTPPGRFAATLPIEGREVQRRRSATAAQARALRRRLTGAEAKLWVHLRRIRTVNTHFRKQVPIGPYIVDFACLRGRLVIEVDGGQHGRFAQRNADVRRDSFLKEQGFTVLRFWNDDVLQTMESVLDTIHAALYGDPSIAADGPRGKDRASSSPLMGEVAAKRPEGVRSADPREGSK